MSRRTRGSTCLILAPLACWVGVLAAPGPTTPTPPAPDDAIVAVTHVDVMPASTAPGRELLRQYVAAARREPGAVRIEVFEEIGRPNHSTVVAVWADRAAFDAHGANEATRAYRGKLQPMLGSPFDERLHRPSNP